MDTFAPEKIPLLQYHIKQNPMNTKLSFQTPTYFSMRIHQKKKKIRGTMLSYIQDKLVNHLLTFHIFYKVILLKTLTII